MKLNSRQRVVNFAAKYSIYIITVLFMAICTLLTDKFLTSSNLVNILRQVTVYAILAFGQAVLLISGNLDLCAGSTCCFTGIVALKAYLSTGSLIVAVLVAMVLGLIINTFSGLVIAQFNLPPFVATMGMQMAIRGLCYVVTDGAMISQTGPNWKVLGQGFVFNIIPISVIIMLVAAVVLYVLLDKMVLGRKFYAMGGSREAARACGINLKKYTVYAYAISGLFIGLAGIVYTSRANCGIATGAQGYEGQAISATVIGGIGFAGGTGSAWGAIIGSVVLGIISNILNLLGVDSYVQQIINGIIIVVAVGLDSYTRSLRVSE